MGDQFFPQTINLAASAVQLVETSLVNPRVWLDAEGLHATDANGKVILDITSGANPAFEGILNALGLTLPTWVPPAPQSQSNISWNNPANGVQDAGIYTKRQGGSNITYMEVLLEPGDTTGTVEMFVTDNAFTRGASVWGEIDATGLDAAKASAGQGAGGKVVTIIGSNGASSFVINAKQSGAMAHDEGNVLVSWPGGANGTPAQTVNHNIGRVPSSITCTATQTSGGFQSVIVNIIPGTVTATQFQIHAWCAAAVPAGGETAAIYWAADG